MPINVIREELNGLKLLEPVIYKDARGHFLESYNKRDFAEIGIDAEFVQDNQSLSTFGTIRGMHFQHNKAQGKLLRVTLGRAIFRGVDIRIDSEFFGQYREFELSAENNRLLWMPPGFANGFSAESEVTVIHYKCTEYWNAASEITLLYNDTDVNIDWKTEDWKIGDPIMSDKDKSGISLRQWQEMQIHL